MQEQLIASELIADVERMLADEPPADDGDFIPVEDQVWAILALFELDELARGRARHLMLGLLYGDVLPWRRDVLDAARDRYGRGERAR